MVEAMNIKSFEVARRTQAQEQGIVESSYEFAARFGVDPQECLIRSANGNGEMFVRNELVFGTREVFDVQNGLVTAGDRMMHQVVDYPDFFPNV